MRRFIVILTAALLILAAPRATFAHAELVSSTPAAGSTVNTAPTSVTGVFSQALAPDDSTMTVEDASGARVDLDDAAVDASDADATTMTVSLRAGLAGGTYTVRWNTFSAEDGEEAAGQFTFTVAASAGNGQAASPAASASARPSASAQASAAATGSPAAAASATPSAAASGQATTLPATGGTALSLWLVMVAGVLLGTSVLLRRRPSA